MNKIIVIDGKEVGFKASALTPRLYRAWLGKDMISDMNKLSKAFTKASKAKLEDDDSTQLQIDDLEIFENCAWVMAKHYDNNIAPSPNEWLDEFSMFSIYEILPSLLELWAINNMTTSHPKKK